MRHRIFKYTIFVFFYNENFIHLSQYSRYFLPKITKILIHVCVVAVAQANTASVPSD